MNHIIIDGYNLIHAIPELSIHLEQSLERARDALLRAVLRYCHARQVEVTIVFDGTAPQPGIEQPALSRRLHIRFSRAPLKADPLIKNLIFKAKAKRSLTIVSDDGEIVRFAKQHHNKTLSCQKFYERMTKARLLKNARGDDQGPEMTEEELADWLRLFGEES